MKPVENGLAFPVAVGRHVVGPFEFRRVAAELERFDRTIRGREKEAAAEA